MSPQPEGDSGADDGAISSSPDESSSEKKVAGELPAPSGNNSVLNINSDRRAAADDEVDDKEAELPLSKARCIALVATVTGASLLNTVSVQAVVIILPTIGKDLDIPESRVQWVVSAYALTFGCFLLLWGRIADLYGKRTIFIWGSVWVAVTTAINPFLPNEIAFDLFRGLQGLGAAANVPTAIGILGTTFPPGKAKNYAFSVYSAGAPLGSVLGNLMSGLIAQYASWKWVFGVIAIVAACISVVATFVIPSPKRTLRDEGVTAKATVDWIGAFLITAGLLALLFALTEGNVVGWSMPYIPVLIVVSVALIVLFVLWQQRLERGGKRTPLMKVSMFHNPRFAAAMVMMALFFSSFNGFLVYATYFFQDYQGLSPLQTTLRFVPTGVSGLITVAVVSQLLAVIPTYQLLMFGNLSVSVAALLFAIPLPKNTTYWAFGFPAMILSVFGADTTWPCLTLFTSRSLPPQDQALGGALVNAMGQVGRSIGLAVATAIQTAVMAQARGVSVQDVGAVQAGEKASLLGLRAAEWLNFGLGVASFSVVVIAFRGSGIVGAKEQKKTETDRIVEGEELDQAQGQSQIGIGANEASDEEKQIGSEGNPAKQ